MVEVEQRARELLAEEYTRLAIDDHANHIRSGGKLDTDDELAIRAITRALQSSERLRAALEAVLNTSGARGEYHALKYADAVEQAERILALQPPEKE